MEVLYFMVPLALAFAGVAVVSFIWAVKNGQYDDMTTPAHRLLVEDNDKSGKKD